MVYLARGIKLQRARRHCKLRGELATNGATLVPEMRLESEKCVKIGSELKALMRSRFGTEEYRQKRRRG
jgi:hypothetical protein